MAYSNPKIPEEINYSTENPLKEFAVLLGGILFIIFVFAITIHLAAQKYAQHIPFEYEKRLISVFSIFGSQEPSDHHQEVQTYLQHLTNNLAKHMDLPGNIALTTHYFDGESINAAATLDGNIFVFKGLLNFVESENELAFVLAHEIAHIKRRHPIKSLSSGVILGIALTAIGIGTDANTSSIINSSSMLSSLLFSRSQEIEADNEALKAVYAHYGHTYGSTHFFERLSEKETLGVNLDILSTHPGLSDRIESIKLIEKSDDSHSLTQIPLLLIDQAAADASSN